jgi:hypothetical protein
MLLHNSRIFASTILQVTRENRVLNRAVFVGRGCLPDWRNYRFVVLGLRAPSPGVCHNSIRDTSRSDDHQKRAFDQN